MQSHAATPNLTSHLLLLEPWRGSGSTRQPSDRGRALIRAAQVNTFCSDSPSLPRKVPTPKHVGQGPFLASSTPTRAPFPSRNRYYQYLHAYLTYLPCYPALPSHLLPSQCRRPTLFYAPAVLCAGLGTHVCTRLLFPALPIWACWFSQAHYLILPCSLLPPVCTLAFARILPLSADLPLPFLHVTLSHLNPTAASSMLLLILLLFMLPG